MSMDVGERRRSRDAGKDRPDYTTKEGAELLRQRIQEAWMRNKRFAGRFPILKLETTPGQTPRTDIRSNMRNGIPPEPEA